MSSKNNDGKIVIVFIILLVAFGLGSGIGIVVGMSGNDLNAPDTQKPINTTLDVTHNISQDNPNYGMDVNSYQDYAVETNDSNKSDSGVYYSEKVFSKKSDQKGRITID